MIVIPAIDIRQGRCAQWASARTRALPLRSDEPEEAASYWERQGFPRLQIMDFDADAQTGRAPDLMRDLLGELSSVVQVGGDIKSGDRVEELIRDGANFVILGRRALDEPEWLDGTAAAFPGQIIVGMRVQGRQLEARGRGRVRSTLGAIEEFADLPLAALLLAPAYGNEGPDAEDLFLLEDAAEASPHPLLVAGGARSMQDLRAMQERGIAGVVIGGALYDGTLDARLVAEEFAE